MADADAAALAEKRKKVAANTRQILRTNEANAMINIRQHSMHFSLADVNGDDTMDYDEFVESMPAHVRASNSPEQLRTWFEMIDLDGSGQVSRDEHLKWSLNAATMASGAGVEKIFQRYDRDGSGQLSELEFARAARDMGLGDHAESLFHALPGSEDGSISYLELLESAKEGKAGECSKVGELRKFLITMAWDTTREPPEKLDTRGWSFAAGSGSELHTALLELMADKHATPTQIFRALDSSNDYLLTRTEFIRGMREALGFRGDAEVLRRAFIDIDDDRTGRIGFDEISTWLNGKDTPKGERLMRVESHLAFRPASIQAVEGPWDAPRLRTEVLSALADLGEPACKPTDLVDWLDPTGAGRIKRREMLQRLKRLVANEPMWHRKVRGAVEELFECLETDHVRGAGSVNAVVESDQLLGWLLEESPRRGARSGNDDDGVGALSAAARSLGRQPTRARLPSPLTTSKPPPKPNKSAERLSRPRSAVCLASTTSRIQHETYIAGTSVRPSTPSAASSPSPPPLSVSDYWQSRQTTSSELTERAASNVRLLLHGRDKPWLPAGGGARSPLLARPRSPPAHYYRTVHGTNVTRYSNSRVGLIARPRKLIPPTPTLSRPGSAATGFGLTFGSPLSCLVGAASTPSLAYNPYVGAAAAR